MADQAQPGVIAGRYQVISRLGAGGMGVVFKATDPGLHRAVAIKALHDLRRLDPRAIDRLRTEARITASLDHPFICKVYEFIESGDDTFLVMEFVEGETLSTLIRGRGKLPVADVLQFASEIAEGLANAHARGLVHRDVKPSNVMVTPHGHIKLLDFGLARIDVESAPADATRSSPGDRSVFGGTPNYMAPEQARGEPITARADLFSLGVLIFECLTGKLPFAGDHAYDYIHHLLSDDPRPLERLAPEVPSDLVTLVYKCLEKSPADRPESAAAVLRELRRLAGRLSAETLPLVTAGDARASRVWRRATILVTVGAAALILWLWFGGSRPEDVVRQARPFVTWPSEESGSRISPTGQWVSFISTRGGETQVFVQPIDGTDAKAVSLPDGRVVSQLWSPDGNQLACVLVQGSGYVLQVVRAFFGGAPEKSWPILPKPNVVRLLRWIDRQVYLQTEDRAGAALKRLDLDSGAVTNLSATWHLDGAPRAFDVRPDGARVVIRITKDGQEDLWIAGLDGGSLKRLTNDQYFKRSPIWNGQGRTILFQSNRGGQIDLWEIAVDGGRSWPVTSSPTEEAPESTSLDGTVLSYTQMSEDAKLWLWDPVGHQSRQLTADALSDFSPVLSADGRTIAFQRARPRPSEGYAIIDSKLFVAPFSAAFELGEPRAVADGLAASLSPDGSWLAYLERRAASARMRVQARRLQTDEVVTLTETGPLPTLTTSPVEWAERTLAWSPSGSDLYFLDQPDGPALRRFRIGARAPEPPLVAAASGELLRDPFVSPDGRRIAYLRFAAQAWTLFEMDLSSGRATELARLTAGPTSVFGRGWLARGDKFVLVRSTASYDDGSADVEVLTAGPRAAVARVALIPHAFISTTRLGAVTGTLFATRSEAGVHNLAALDLATGVLRRLTDNTLPGVTLSGVSAVGDRMVLGVRDERKKDVWLMETKK